MNDIKITDLVDQSAFDQLDKLDKKINDSLETYKTCAMELAKGIKMPIEVSGDLDKLQQVYGSTMREAKGATEQLTGAMEKQRSIVADTTNTISRQLAEQEKLNATQREAFQADTQWVSIANNVLGTREKNITELAETEMLLKKAAEATRSLSTTDSDYAAKRANILSQEQELKARKSELVKILNNEEKANQAAVGSYTRLSLELERMKMAYKKMTDEQKASATGQQLAQSIGVYDNRLKDLAADMGEFQRNVGNYAIAGKKAYATTEQISKAMNEQAKSVRECQEQNKILAQAISEVDRSEAGASQKVEQYTKKIQENEAKIKQYSGTAGSEIDSVLQVFGVNSTFGTSIQTLSSVAKNGEGVMTSLTGKVKALGSTVMGLLSNPAVLALLGIGGVIMAGKWWYDYNKGLVEATKLTKKFTDETGAQMQATRSDIQAVADQYGKTFKEMATAANSLSKQMGISFNEAIEDIKDGFIAGADISGTFLQDLKQYPAVFKDAGVSARELIALMSQQQTNGIGSEKQLSLIMQGTKRIREMRTATAQALEGIGISAKQVESDLTSGSKSMFEIIQEIATKIGELPANSKEVGTALKAVFGRSGADSGIEYVKMLQSIGMNLDTLIGKTGKLGQIQKQQMNANAELQRTLAAIFDKTGGSFEIMVGKIKIFATETLTMIIKKSIDIINYFVDLYNNSMLFRAMINGFILEIRSLWSVVAMLFKDLFTDIKALASLFQAMMTGNFSAIPSIINAARKQLVGNAKDMVKDIGDAFTDGLHNMGTKLSRISLDAGGGTRSGGGSTGGGGGGTGGGTGTGTGKGSKNTGSKTTDSSKSEEEINEMVLKSQVDMLKQKLENVKEYSSDELELRKTLLEKQEELDEMENKKQLKSDLSELDKTFSAKKISAEKYNQMRKQLADDSAQKLKDIHQKMLNDEEAAESKYADKLVEEEAAKAAAEQAIADNQYSRDISNLNYEYAERIKAAKGNADAVAEIEREYAVEKDKIDQDYAIATVQRSIDTLQTELEISNISAENKKKIMSELAKKQAELDSKRSALAKKQSEDEAKAADGQKKIEEKLHKQKMDNVKSWMNKSKEALSNISALFNSIYEARISKIEAEEEANNTAYSSEEENITRLADQKIISTEEAEARKRAAEERTSAKNTELEKKKQRLKHKEAVVDKINSLAQTAIATALGIMAVWDDRTMGNLAKIAMTAFVGTMGAIQMATIAATPIASYAKGTKDKIGHRGGLALVGDANKSELVAYNGNAWITPDTPTLVDLPRGAQVFPDANKMDISGFRRASALPSVFGKSGMLVINDYSKLEKRVDRTNSLLSMTAGELHAEFRRQRFDRYISRRV
jgi:hypothetical protein